MRLWRYGIVSLIVAALVASGAAFYSIIQKRGLAEVHVLVIRNTDSGRVYGKWALHDAGEFAIEFIHSVNQSPVREFYRIEGGLVRPLAVRFASFGAGMQSDLEDGLILSREGDALLISGFNTAYKELNYIVGTVSDHLLIINDEQFSLQELCGRNAHITIHIE